MKKLVLFILCFFLIPLVSMLAAFAYAQNANIPNKKIQNHTLPNAKQIDRYKRASANTKLLPNLKNFNLLNKNDYKSIRKINQNKFLIPKDLRIKALLSLPNITKEATAVKTIIRGGKSGYLITYIEKDSVFRKLGLEVGDVLTKINGAELTNSKQVSRVFSNTVKVDKINLEVRRDLRKVVLGYEFI